MRGKEHMVGEESWREGEDGEVYTINSTNARFYNLVDHEENFIIILVVFECQVDLPILLLVSENRWCYLLTSPLFSNPRARDIDFEAQKQSHDAL
jgi:hypothetical protein